MIACSIGFLTELAACALLILPPQPVAQGAGSHLRCLASPSPADTQFEMSNE
jgi:hypothetical protein